MIRRSAYDPLEPTLETRWYVVRSTDRTILETQELPPGTDLKRALLVAMVRWIDAGWTLGEFTSRLGTFFCRRGIERMEISIEHEDPYRLLKLQREYQFPPQSERKAS